MNYISKLRKINYIYGSFLRSHKVKENTMLLESFHGKAFIGDPYAMLLAMLEDPAYRKFKFIVAINDKNLIANPLIRNSRKVKFVEVGSKSYLYHLATSKYLVNSVSFPSYFVKCENQVYLNTWHGTPFKTLGKDMKNVKGTEVNIMSNFNKSDYMIHTCNYARDRIEESHNLNSWKGSSFLSAPRFDLYKENEYVVDYLVENFEIDFSKEIILYCPTWQGNLKNISSNHAQTIKTLRKLQLDNPDKVILLKVHSLIYSRMSEEEKEFVVDDKFDLIELMYYSDTLITDYSSAFFDYMYTGKKIIHYMPNFNEYSYDRGLYLTEDELPGLVAKSYKHLKQYLNDDSEVVYNVNYNRYIELEVETAELISTVIKKPEFVVNEKKNVLLYAGGFSNNGITTSIINFSNYFDYDNYNLYIVEKFNPNETETKNISKLDERVNMVYRSGNLVAGLKESVKYRNFLKTGIIDESDEKLFTQMFTREHKRIFGDLEFDTYIDFSGYVNFWTAFMAFSNNKQKFIYQHNDMYSEYYKVVNNKRVHIDKLRCVFNLYKYYDKVIAVSEEIMDLNHVNLNEYYDEEKKLFIGNFINPNTIFESVVDVTSEDIATIYKISNKNNPTHILNKYKKDTALLNKFGLTSNLNMDAISDEKPLYCGYFGRISPEKGQLNFINMLPDIVKEIPNIVVIFVGDGPELKKCKQRVAEFDLQAHVVFTGQLENAYPVMELVDIVLLLSSSEGQPMVLLEALTLGKNTIASDIEGNRSVLKNGYGQLIEANLEEIIDSIKEPERYSLFDVNAYNIGLKQKYQQLLGNLEEEVTSNEVY